MQIRALTRSLPEGDAENSPGWSPPTRTEPWESRPSRTATSRRDGRISTPHISRIVFNAMFFQKGNVLRSKITLPMMLLLVCNVGERRRHLGPSDGKRAITLLPFEVIQRARFMHPARGCTFDCLHRRGYRERRRQREKNMNVVFHSTYAKRLHLVLACNAAHISPQSRLDIRDNRIAPLFGGEDTMKQRATIGV